MPVRPTGKMPVLLLPVPAIEARDFTFCLAMGRAFFQVRAFVVRDFALRDPDLGF
jgi:hypothetical protein